MAWFSILWGTHRSTPIKTEIQRKLTHKASFGRHGEWAEFLACQACLEEGLPLGLAHRLFGNEKPAQTQLVLELLQSGK